MRHGVNHIVDADAQAEVRVFERVRGFGGGGRGRAVVGPVLEPGTYMIRLVVGGKTLTSSVDVLEDQWMGRQ